MKIAKLFLAGCLVVTTLFSCSKDNEEPPAPVTGVAGKWVGTYGFGNETPHVFYSLNIKTNGVIEELNKSGNSKGDGSWNLNGSVFTAQYQWKAPMNSKYSIKATYNGANGKLSGTWGYDNSATDGGLWEAEKSN